MDDSKKIEAEQFIRDLQKKLTLAKVVQYSNLALIPVIIFAEKFQFTNFVMLFIVTLFAVMFLKLWIASLILLVEMKIDLMSR